ncbi:hypothetical protein ACET3Z_025087 [Daucus carota]
MAIEGKATQGKATEANGEIRVKNGQGNYENAIGSAEEIPVERSSRVNTGPRKSNQGRKDGSEKSEIHNKQSRDNHSCVIEKEAIEVCKYSFLLEDEMVNAIQKGNYDLVPIASARIDYLKGAIEPGLLKEGLNGEEEALWEIHRILFNDGWWTRAENLKYRTKINPRADSILGSFLKANDRLIHPNTRAAAISGDTEGIRMALNQIHYNSLTERPRNKGVGKTSKADLMEITRSFLQGLAQFIEPSVLKDALQGNDKALSLALGQIHFHSLDNREADAQKRDNGEQKSFKEILLEQHTEKIQEEIVKDSLKGPNKKIKHWDNYGIKKRKSEHSVFFTGFSDHCHTKDLWKLFKRAGKIKDIILPQKRDKFGNRFGFLIMENEAAVQAIIKQLNTTPTTQGTLYLSKAKERNVITKPSPQGDKRKPRVSRPPSPKRHTEKSEESPEKAEINQCTSSAGKKNPLDPRTKANITLGSDCYAQNISTPNLGHLEREQVSSIDPCEDMIQVLNTSIFLPTAKNETVESVKMIAEGLRAYNFHIRGISGTTFIAYFPNKVDFDLLDRDFLELGFMEVRAVKVEDLIPCRKTWVEVRGLPIIGWTEENFKSLLRDHGNVLLFSKIYDSEGFYQHPKFLIETGCIEDICIHKTVQLMQKKWKIRIIEIAGNDVILNDVASQSDEDCSPIKTHSVSSFLSPNPQEHTQWLDNHNLNSDQEHHHVSPSPVTSAKVDVIESLAHIKTQSTSNQEPSSQSAVNPLTPKSTAPFIENDRALATSQHMVIDETGPAIQSQQKSKDEKGPEKQSHERSRGHIIDSKTSNWRPRDRQSSPSSLNSISNCEDKLSPGESYNSDLVNDCCGQDILKSMDKLRVKSKRGRPRKFNSKLLNKHFRVPRKKKSKIRGEGLQQISHFFLNDSHDEVDAIYESGLLMGLLPVSNREQSLEFIRKNLTA